MITATGKSFTRFYVIGENLKTYSFITLSPALGWASELIDIFGEDSKNVSVFERKYDELGNMITETKLF